MLQALRMSKLPTPQKIIDKATLKRLKKMARKNNPDKEERLLATRAISNFYKNGKDPVKHKKWSTKAAIRRTTFSEQLRKAKAALIK